MAYRTFVNNIQIFGNNALPPRWGDYLEENNIVKDEEYVYAFDTRDFMGILKVMEQIVMDYEKEQQEKIKDITKYNPHFENLPDKRKEEVKSRLGLRSIYDLTPCPEDIAEDAFFDQLMEYTKSAKMFLPYAFFRACEKDLEQEPAFSIPGRIYSYHLKSGKMIHIEAR